MQIKLICIQGPLHSPVSSVFSSACEWLHLQTGHTREGWSAKSTSFPGYHILVEFTFHGHKNLVVTSPPPRHVRILFTRHEPNIIMNSLLTRSRWISRSTSQSSTNPLNRTNCRWFEYEYSSRTMVTYFPMWVSCGRSECSINQCDGQG